MATGRAHADHRVELRIELILLALGEGGRILDPPPLVVQLSAACASSWIVCFEPNLRLREILAASVSCHLGILSAVVALRAPPCTSLTRRKASRTSENASCCATADLPFWPAACGVRYLPPPNAADGLVGNLLGRADLRHAVLVRHHALHVAIALPKNKGGGAVRGRLSIEGCEGGDFRLRDAKRAN